MSKFPEPVQTLYETALAHEKTGKWGAAAACYEQAVTLVTDSAELWARYARLLGSYGVYNEDGHDDMSAGVMATKCPAVTAEELYWRAIGATLNDGNGDAQKDLVASLALDPTNAEVWYEFAEALEAPAAYYFGDGYDTSVAGQAQRQAAYDQALALKPDNIWYLAARGSFFLAHDRLEEALADLNTVLALKPSDYSAKRDRGIIRFLQHDFRGALRDFAVGRAAYGGDWRDIKVKSYLRYPAEQLPLPEVRWAQALAAFEQAGIPEPTTAKYLSGRAAYYKGNGSLDLALADARAAVARQPRVPEYRQLLVDCLEAFPKPDLQALSVEYEWLAAHPIPIAPDRQKSPYVKLDIARQRWTQTYQQHRAAWLLYHLGRRQESLAYFEAACGFAITQAPYWVRREENFTWYPADPDCGPDVPRREAMVEVNGEKYHLGDISKLLPPMGEDLPPTEGDVEYLRWQFNRQLRQQYTDSTVMDAAAQWLCSAAWTLAGPPLGDACEAFSALVLPARYYFVQPREEDAFIKARQLCLSGLAQCPAYTAEFRLLQQVLLRAELRNTQNRPGATPALIEAAVERYDAGLAELRAQSQGAGSEE